MERFRLRVMENAFGPPVFWLYLCFFCVCVCDGALFKVLHGAPKESQSGVQIPLTHLLQPKLKSQAWRTLAQQLRSRQCLPLQRGGLKAPSEGTKAALRFCTFRAAKCGLGCLGLDSLWVAFGQREWGLGVWAGKLAVVIYQCNPCRLG